MGTDPEPLRGDALDFVVKLLFELGDAAADSAPFHDRICEAICRLTTLKRAVLFLYDTDRRLVVPAGSHGVEPEILAHTYGNIEETPIAQRALVDDEVVVVERLEGQVPERYAGLPGVVGISCTPVAAGGRWLGVIFAEADGEPLELDADERRTMHALGRTAALATTVLQAAAQRERDALLLERIELAREVHESVMQRLFGVSMVLWWEPDVEVPDGLEPLAVSVLSEALRNAEKHAEPTHVRVAITRVDGAFALEVRNDGLGPARPAASGLGLRLASYESLQRGGMLEFGPEGDDWRVRLVLPASDVASVVGA
jgi:signal transduction histidine kinase